MNNKLKRTGLIVGLAAVVALIILLLTMCGRSGEEGQTQDTTPVVETTEPSEATDATSEPTEESSEPTEEATEPTEEPTEPSEEATEPTEEATEPTTGGNTNPGGNNGPSIGEDDEEEEEFVVSAPGAEDNPYTEGVAQIPGGFTTVKIPAEGTISYDVYGADESVLTIESPNAYVIVGETTYEPDENGVITVELDAGDGMGFVSFRIGNRGGEEEVYTLNFAGQEGSEANPEQIASVTEILATLDAGDENGHYYQWIADTDGVLTLTPEAITPEGAECDIIITNGDVSVSLSQGGVTDETTGNTGVSIEVAEGDEISIQIVAVPDETGAYPELEAQISGSIGAPEGSEENPYEAMLSEVPASVTTEEIGGGETVHYAVTGAGGTILTIEDADAVVVYNGVTYAADESGVVTVALEAVMGRQPVAFQVSNTGAEAESYTMNFALPLGAYNNPAELLMGDNAAELEANDSDGYWYGWTAPDNGTLVITMDTAQTTTGWVYGVSNVTAGTSSDNHWNDDETVVLSETLEVTAGDTILVNVNTYESGSWNTPEGTVVIHAEFTAEEKPAGSEENPIWIMDVEAPTESAVPAGETYYYTGYIFDMTMTMENAAGMTVEIDGVAYTADENGILTVEFPAAAGMGRPMPVVFTIANGTEADSGCTMTFAYHVGTQMNPAELVIGGNTADVPQASSGYFYSWTAQEDGNLTITMDCEDWFYVVNNLTAGAYGENHWSDEEYPVSGETIQVTAGDEIQITVNTSQATAGQVTFTAAFDPAGSETNPIWIEDITIITEAAVPAGQTRYYTGYLFDMPMIVQNASGTTVSLNGNTYTPDEAGNLTIDLPPATGLGRPLPVVFSITNSGGADTVCIVFFDYPVGDQMTPAGLVMGQNTATLEAGDSDGYWFLWTAGETGTLTITMPTDTGWSYVVNNLTTYRYGDIQTSDVSPVIQEIPVNAGDEIQINMSTFAPENPFAVPAGDVVFQATFSATEAAQLSLEEPLMVHLKPNDLWLEEEARLVAYFWNEEEEFWVELVLDEETGYYSCQVPEDCTNVIFYRMDPEEEKNILENVWNKTKKLTIDTEKEDPLYEMGPEALDEGEGRWTTLEDALQEALAKAQAEAQAQAEAEEQPEEQPETETEVQTEAPAEPETEAEQQAEAEVQTEPVTEEQEILE